MNWPSLIAELQKHYTQPEIAKECGCAQSTISDLANGHTAEPRHSLGEDLRRLLEKARAEKAGA